MKLALLADIHANLEALHAVLAALDGTDADEIWCLGDIVGYGADPGPCLELIREKCALTVAGNHDTTAANLAQIESYNPFAKQALRWTHDRLDTAGRDWLAGLPLRVARAGCIVFHGSLSRRNDYIDGEAIARLNLELLRAQYADCLLALHGHTHVKSVASEDGGFLPFTTARAVPLSPGRRYLLNPGAVGQPRDNSPLASYGLLDTEARVFEVRTVAYDIAAAQRKIRAAGLPALLADRLATGT